MSDGFGHNLDAERALASQMRAHGDEVANHGARLSANTEGRVGTGPLGEVAETAVRRILGAFAQGFSSALKRFFHSTADIAEQNVRRVEQVEADTRASLGAIRPQSDLPHTGPLVQVHGPVAHTGSNGGAGASLMAEENLRSPNPRVRRSPHTEHQFTPLEPGQEGFQSRLPGSGPFEIDDGEVGATYLWTVDGRGTNIAQQTILSDGSEVIKHTNLSSQASIAGEVRFGPNNTIVDLDANSGRFGRGHPYYRGDPAALAANLEEAKAMWQSLGYRFEVGV